MLQCTATKYAFPTAIGNRSVFLGRHDMGSAPAYQRSPISTSFVAIETDAET